VRLVETGALAVQVGWRGKLSDFADAAEGLHRRKIRGQAIMDVHA